MRIRRSLNLPSLLDVILIVLFGQIIFSMDMVPRAKVELDKANAEIGSATIKLEITSQEIVIKKTELASLTKAVTDNTAEKDKLASEAASLSFALRDKTDQLSDLSARISALIASNTTLDEENRAKKEDIKKTRTELVSATIEADKAKIKAKDIQSKVDSLNSAIAESTRDRNKLASEVLDLQTGLAQKTALLASLTGNISTLTASNSLLTEENQSSKDELEKTKQDLSSAKAAAEDAQAKINDLEAKMASLTMKLIAKAGEVTQSAPKGKDAKYPDVSFPEGIDPDLIPDTFKEVIENASSAISDLKASLSTKEKAKELALYMKAFKDNFSLLKAELNETTIVLNGKSLSYMVSEKSSGLDFSDLKTKARSFFKREVPANSILLMKIHPDVYEKAVVEVSRVMDDLNLHYTKDIMPSGGKE